MRRADPRPELTPRAPPRRNHEVNKMTWKIAVIVTALFACSSGNRGFSGTDPSSSGGSGSGGGTPASSSGSNSGDGSGSSGGSSSAGVSQDGAPDIPPDASVVTNGYDADIPDAELGQPVTLTLSPFTVPPNSEVFKCQQFGNPWGH